MSNYLELIVGSMFSGKTTELIRRIDRYRRAGKEVKVFTPTKNKRDKSFLKTRHGLKIEGTSVSSPQEILDFAEDRLEGCIIAIDEIQFFDESIIEVIMELINRGYKILASGIELDCFGQIFPTVATLMCYSDSLTKLNSICVKCGSEFGCRNQRISSDGKSILEGKVFVCDDGKNYEPRCIKCFETKIKEGENINDREFGLVI